MHPSLTQTKLTDLLAFRLFFDIVSVCTALSSGQYRTEIHKKTQEYNYFLQKVFVQCNVHCKTENFEEKTYHFKKIASMCTVNNAKGYWWWWNVTPLLFLLCSSPPAWLWLQLPIHQQPNSAVQAFKGFSSSCCLLRLKMFVLVLDVEIFLFQIRGWERKPWGESSAETVGEWRCLSAGSRF